MTEDAVPEREARINERYSVEVMRPHTYVEQAQALEPLSP